MVILHLVFCISLGLLYIFVVVLLVWFCFLSTSQENGWEEHLWNDLLCVEWDVKP